MIHRHGEINVYGNLITEKMCAACVHDESLKKVRLLESDLNGKKIAYHSRAEFLVQVGRGKSSYTTRYTIIGSLSQAVMYYNGVNIGNGYKKRLVCWGLNKPLLARQFSD